MQLSDLLQFREMTAAEGSKPPPIGKNSLNRNGEEKMLKHFVQWLRPNWEEFIKQFDNEGFITFEGFQAFAKWEGRYKGDVGRVFDQLDREIAGIVNIRVFLELRRAYESNLDMQFVGLTGLKRLMIGKYITLGRTWRKVFDKEDSGKCCYTAFVKSCREHGFTGDVRSTWDEITDGDRQRPITLKDWDPEMHTLLNAFVKLLTQRHGTLRKGWVAFLASGSNNNNRPGPKDWQTTCKGLGFSSKDSKNMFTCLDNNLTKSICQEELQFLFYWDNGPSFSAAKKERVGLGPTPLRRRQVDDDHHKAEVPNYEAEDVTNYEADEVAKPAFEFVVVLSKQEYGEYLKKRRDRQISGGYKDEGAQRKFPHQNIAGSKGSRRSSTASEAQDWASIHLGKQELSGYEDGFVGA